MNFAKLESAASKDLYLARASRPEVDTGAKPDSERVLGGPVYKIEVEVVLQGWRIQYLQT